MTTLRPAAAPRTTPIRPPEPAQRAFVVAGFGVILLAAFLLRVRLLTHGAGFASSDGYDDGVYYAAADALVHGRLPYRDFLLLHPPGIVLALAPFAALGSAVGDHVGVAVARLAFIGIGTLNVGLLMRWAARHSRAAAAVTGVVAAAWFPLAYAERSTLLEPLGDLLVLAALLVGRRAGAAPAVVAGVLAGTAVTVKAWYVLPLLVLLAFLPRRRVPFLAGAAGGAAVVVLPFLATAPGRMVQEVVLDQLGRARMSTSAVMRAVTILGSPHAPAGLTAHAHFARDAAAAVGVVLLLVAVAAWRVHWARVAVVQLLASAALLMASPSFFLHYAGFAAPWVAASVGVGAAVAASWIRPRWIRLNAIALLCTAFVAVNATADLAPGPRPQPVQQLRPLLAAQPGCVVSDDPGLLANADVLSRDLAAGCPLWPDVTGWTYDRDAASTAGRPVARADDARWQRDLMRYLLSGDVLVLDRPSTGLSAGSLRRVAQLPVLGRAGGLAVRATGPAAR